MCNENGTEGFYKVRKSLCDEYVSTLTEMNVNLDQLQNLGPFAYIPC